MVKDFLNIDPSTLPEEVRGLIQGMQMILKNEKNSLLDLGKKVQELHHENASLIQENTTLKESTKIAEEKAAWLAEENERLRRMIQKRVMQLYGVKSERLGLEQLSLFSEPALLVKQEPSLEIEEILYSDNNSQSPKAKKPSKGKAIDSSLERVDIIVDLDDTEKLCACCGTKKSLIGEEVSERLGIIPIKLYVNRYHRQKYACRVCEEGVQIAPHEPVLLPKCMADPSLLAHIITAKYVDHLPLYRQEAILGRIGIDLSRGTLCTWTLRVAEALKPLYDHIHKKIVAGPYVQADETPLKVLKERDRKAQSKSYMWLYKSGTEGFVIYDYQPTRKGDNPSRMLKGFQGYLQKDAYSGYNGISSQKGVISVMCWAHARRKFYEVSKLTQSKKGFSHEMLSMIGHLYKVERECKEQALTPDKIKTIRKRRCISLLRKMKAKLEKAVRQAPSQSDIGAAIQYTLNNWRELIQYLKDGRIHIDNNAAERAIKPFVIGRKNWLFNQNERGARAGAILFSLMETAKAHGANPQAYLEFVIKKFPTTDNLDNLLPNAYLKTLSNDKTI